MDYKGIYDLYVFAFGDEALARRAQAQALERYVDHRCR